MAYTPELSIKSSSTLRRLAWAHGKPMTKTLEDVMNSLPAMFDKRLICSKCRDKSKCAQCVFKEKPTKQNKFTNVMKKKYR